MDLSNLSITRALELLDSRTISSEHLVTYYLNQIKELNNEYNVFLSVRSDEDLLAYAKKADKERAEGSTKKLLGIPFSVKDSYMTESLPTTAGDLYLKDGLSEYTATAVQRLLDEGAILLGKVNMDSWGFGSTTENSAYGPTLNPVDKSRSAGGSSGGSGAAVALDMCMFSIGEDTGGSIRTPANFCGVYGLKPSYGRISRYGCIAYGSSLDTVGPITRAPQDIKIVFDILKGMDGKDTTIQDIDEKQIQDNAIRKNAFAYSLDFIPEGINEDVKNAYLRTIEELKSKGYKAIECSFTTLKYAIPTYYITAMSEASTNLARYNGTRYGKFSQEKDSSITSWEDLFKKSRSNGFGDEAKRRIFLGSYVLSEGYYDAYYKKAQKIRSLIAKEMSDILEDVDFILSPVTPTPALKIGEKATNPVEMYLEDVFTVTANLTGMPALAYPAGVSKENLPIGMQVIGQKNTDEKLTSIISEVVNNKLQ
jgi:aspartyl-tRNA(Asn)/glutamyl-tRNA(Gln) amidotransferase subunit A